MGSISRALKSLAHWLDTRFPEKLTASEVRKDILELREAASDAQKITHSMGRRIFELEKSATDTKISALNQLSALQTEVERLKEEMNKAKTYLAIKSRIIGNDTMFKPPQPKAQ